MSYSVDLREKVLKYREAHTQAETREIFGISVSAIKRWQKQLKEQGNVEKAELKRVGRKIKTEELKADVEKYPEDFNRERAERFGCTEEAIRQAMKRNKLTRKKKVIEYRERDEAKRSEYQEEISEIAEAVRVYIDESGINQYLYREYGYALRGERVYGKIPGKKYERLSMVAGKCGEEIIGRYEYTCNMNSKLFELWFCEVLLKLIPAGSVIIMDNASWHRKKILKKLAAAVGCRVIFLPPYSPDFNPIEKVWAALKKFIRHYMRNYSSLNLAVLAFFESG